MRFVTSLLVAGIITAAFHTYETVNCEKCFGTLPTIKAQEGTPENFELPEWYPSVLTAVAERLAGAVPLNAPVYVSVEEIPNMWGISWYDENAGAYRIGISPGALDPDFLVDIIIHEWAHCVIWGSNLDEGSFHGAEWGVAYAACYRAVIEGPPLLLMPVSTPAEDPSAAESAEPPAEKCGD